MEPGYSVSPAVRRLMLLASSGRAAPQQPRAKPVCLYMHLYDPLRHINAARTPHTLSIVPRPEPEANPEEGSINWTHTVANRVYIPLMGEDPETSAYRHLPFNLGPTLLMALTALFGEKFVADLKVADQASQRDNNGHGNANAMGFHHAILPLARPLDRSLQIKWGIEHYRATYGREPEGFWLPEAAVDATTLIHLKKEGIKYVILSPSSAKSCWNGTKFVPVQLRDKNPEINYGRPYKVRLPGDQEMAVFLFDFWLSKTQAFDGLLADPTGQKLAEAVDSRFAYFGDPYAFSLSATDGETYGHHVREGLEAVLTYTRELAAKFGHALTNPGRLLAEAEEQPEIFGRIELKEPSSWSCEHGVGRWSNDCGCEGSNPWRYDLRIALEFLAGEADRFYDRLTAELFRDPTQARLDYIQVLLGQDFGKDYLSQQVHPEKVITKERYLKLSAMFDALYSQQELFLSCGWYFDGIGYQTGLNFAAASDLIRRLKNIDPAEGGKVELAFIEKLANMPNSLGKTHPFNAAQLYFWVLRGQEYWLQKYLEPASAGP